MTTTMENENKHTPGPWTYRDEANREEVWIGVPGRSIGMMVIATVQYGFTPPANLEQQANARLIAAAPDMLLKLRGCSVSKACQQSRSMRAASAGKRAA